MLLNHSFEKRKKNTKLYFINVKGDEFGEYKKKFRKSLQIDYGGLNKTDKNSGIIIEDIIHMSKIDEKNMRTSLNFSAHHKRQKIFSISHGIHKTSLWGMLSFFHFLIFTSSSSNVPVLRYTLNYFKIDKDIVDSWIEQFKKLGLSKKNHYFYFNCSEMSFYFTPNILDLDEAVLIGNLSSGSNSDSGENLEVKRKNLQTKFEKFLEGHSAKPQASAIFSSIINSLDLKMIREHDLSVCFNNLGGEKLKRISLVDYITCVLTPNQSAPNSLIALHKYIKNYCLIPCIFIKNTSFNNCK